MRGLLRSPPFVPVLCLSVGLRGTTRCSACPVLRHSESGLHRLSVRECGAAGSASGQTAFPVCSSHTPPVSVPPPQLESSPPWCPSPPLLAVWMNVSFLSTWFWTSLLFDFLSVLVVREEAQCVHLRRHLGSPRSCKVFALVSSYSIG